MAFGSLAIGMISDRLGSRRGGDARLRVRSTRCRGCRCCCAWRGRCRRPSRWFLLMGLLIPGFTLSWTVAKEVNRPEHSGIATVGGQRRHLPRHRHPAAAGRPG
ncbi:MAG: hypothetical protein MZW92_33140 [Comamonadaceae bacterium]|nr:hypothetical protein [Comamonadaceae bacterium]